MTATVTITITSTITTPADVTFMKIMPSPIPEAAQERDQAREDLTKQKEQALPRPCYP